MNAKQAAPTGTTIRVTEVNATEQARRTDEAIAHRAYEIFEQRGGMGWHELEDWRRAESEIRSKLCVGVTSSDDALIVSCDVAGFEMGTVEVWAAPRQITICGNPISHREAAARPRPYCGIIFRVVQLPIEVEPSRVVTTLKRNFLEIYLPIVRFQTGTPGPSTRRVIFGSPLRQEITGLH
jgi:HSP20 family molecular chaperone IbpA